MGKFSEENKLDLMINKLERDSFSLEKEDFEELMNLLNEYKKLKSRILPLYGHKQLSDCELTVLGMSDVVYITSKEFAREVGNEIMKNKLMTINDSKCPDMGILDLDYCVEILRPEK